MLLQLGLMYFSSQNASIRAELSCHRVISPTLNNIVERKGNIDHRGTCDNAEAKKMLFPAQSMATLPDNDTLLKSTSTELPEDFPLKFSDAIECMSFLRITCCLTEHGTYANGRD